MHLSTNDLTIDLISVRQFDVMNYEIVTTRTIVDMSTLTLTKLRRVLAWKIIVQVEILYNRPMILSHDH